MTILPRRSILAGAAASLAPSIGRAALPVRVASKQDTEGGLLGNIIVALLTAGGVPNRSRLQMGNTRIVRSALLAREIEIYPEYTGNGAFFFSMDSDPLWKNPQAAYDKVKALDAERNGIAWLARAPANNTWGIAVRGDVAKQANLRTLEDFARWVNGGAKVRVAASAEFMESPAALPAFQSAYGFKLAQEQTLVLAGGDTAATERAAAEGTSGVNAAMAYGTDGAIAALGLVLLEDPKGAQMVYEPAPTIRQAVLNDYPKIPELLAPAFSALDGPTLRSLNAKVAVEGQDSAAVAKSWLQAKGMLA